MGIKAVLWDFGGVLTTSPFDAFNRYEKQKGIPINFIRGVNSVNPNDNAWAKFESSRITVEQFDDLFLEETTAKGHAIPGRDVIPLLGGDVRPKMVEVLKRCKQDYQVVCLTNNANAGSGPGMADSEERAEAIREVMKLFDLVIESSKEGMRKPDPEIYELACKRMQAEPQEIVYLDDLGINLKPARGMGMQTIKVVTEDQAINELSNVLNMEFSF